MPRLKDKYRSEVVPAMMEVHGYRNIMQVPRLVKVVLNVGVGEALKDAKVLESAQSDLAAISGQHPVTTRAHRSIAAFRSGTCRANRICPLTRFPASIWSIVSACASSNNSSVALPMLRINARPAPLFQICAGSSPRPSQ